MSSNTKERLLHDLEALRHQLAEIEAYGTEREGDVPATVNIPTLETDNIPLLGDAVPVDREEAIAAHRAAMAQLDAELKELDKKEANTETSAANNSEHQPAPSKAEAAISAPVMPTPVQPAAAKPINPKAATFKPAPKQPQVAAPLTAPPAQHATTAPQPFVFEGIAPTMTAPKPVNTSDDNPFLPAHLRERLNKSKSSLLEEIARSSESLDASTALLRNFGQNSHELQPARPQTAEAHYQDIVDTLVAKYLPLIEADLRQRLSTALAQQVAAQKKPEHSH